ncbi:MAG: N-acetyl-gamma-glutamyl-phosphate reductase [Firmicutes bacterium]|nr:N-acetyl-gamma-glutamyl-phosphate reductase [Bacillota bacterium]
MLGAHAKKSIGIIGGNGYTGGELLRILLRHPGVRIEYVISRKEAGRKVDAVFPDLQSCGLEFSEASAADARADVVFSCLPHAASAEYAAKVYRAGSAVIDLSADFRYRDLDIYQKTYQVTHPCPELIQKSVYGLPELYRDKIKKSQLIGNPGCYTTCSILSLAPLLKCGLIRAENIIIDAKSGASGAGKKTEEPYLYCEVNENFRAYAVLTHRHTSEIDEVLSLQAGKSVSVTFTPHLLPVNRGILCTIYAEGAQKLTEEAIYNAYARTYQHEPFIHIRGDLPDLKSIAYTNNFHLGFRIDAKNNRLIVVSVLDNLLKGASGQAVQNMNILMGFDETTGLI